VVAEHAFTLPGAPERMFLQRGAERLARDAEILTAPPDTLLSQWENAVRQAVRTKVAVEDELHKAGTEWNDHIKRTHDYEPFIEEYVKSLHKDGLLDIFLNDGKPAKSNEGETLDRPKAKKKPRVEAFDIEEEQEQEGMEEDSGDDDWKPTSRRK